jgi:hypothetical protein
MSQTKTAKLYIFELTVKIPSMNKKYLGTAYIESYSHSGAQNQYLSMYPNNIVLSVKKSKIKKCKT